MNPSDKRIFLLVVLVFGCVAAAVSARWLSTGNITIRHGKAHSAAAQPTTRPAGQIPGDHILFYPIAIAWGLLGTSMIVLATLAFLRSDTVFARLSAYCLALVLVLGFTTLVTAMLVKPP
jgi:hypothetical protein